MSGSKALISQQIMHLTKRTNKLEIRENRRKNFQTRKARTGSKELEQETATKSRKLVSPPQDVTIM